MNQQYENYKAFMGAFQGATKGNQDASLQITTMMVQQLGARVDKFDGNTIYVTVPKINKDGLYADELAKRIKGLFNTGGQQYKVKCRTM